MTPAMLKLIIALLTITLTLLPTLAPDAIGQSGNAPQGITWVNQINCTATGGSLAKTGGRDDTADAAARSQQTITAGDAYLEFSAAQTNKLLYTGLTHRRTIHLTLAALFSIAWAGTFVTGIFFLPTPR